MSGAPTNSIYTYTFTVPESAIDENGHVNNVVYVQWMQDAAVRHFNALGGEAPMREHHATWVVHEHRIQYLNPAFAGEEIEVRTWIADVRRVRSLRKYEFLSKKNGGILVRGETDWVFVDAGDGRPKAIPESVTAVFPPLTENPDHT